MFAIKVKSEQEYIRQMSDCGKDIKRNQQNVNHDARERKHLNHHGDSHRFVRICVILDKGVIKRDCSD